MAGATTLDQVPELLRGIVAGMMEHPIHRLACRVLEHHGKEARAQALEQIPAAIRDQVRAEALKLFERRRAANKAAA